MLNLNEEMEYMEEVDGSHNFEEETQTQYEYYNSDYNVNYFGVGRGYEDWQ